MYYGKCLSSESGWSQLTFESVELSALSTSSFYQSSFFFGGGGDTEIVRTSLISFVPLCWKGWSAMTAWLSTLVTQRSFYLTLNFSLLTRNSKLEFSFYFRFRVFFNKIYKPHSEKNYGSMYVYYTYCLWYIQRMKPIIWWLVKSKKALKICLLSLWIGLKTWTWKVIIIFSFHSSDVLQFFSFGGRVQF